MHHAKPLNVKYFLYSIATIVKVDQQIPALHPYLDLAVTQTTSTET